MPANMTGADRTYAEFLLGVAISLIEKRGLDVFVAMGKIRDHEDVIRRGFEAGLAETTVAVEVAEKS